MNTPLIKNTVKLTDKAVKALEVTGKPQKFFDEKGLYLYVTEKGLKSWRYDYRVGGKRATVTFGRYPDVTLSLARKKHLEARANLANGGDPAREKKVQKLERQNQLINTFDDIAKAWYEGKQARRSSEWRESHSLYLRRDLSPFIGNLPLAEISGETLLAVLEKCRVRSGAKTADRVRQTAVQVFDYGKRKLKVSSNVAKGLVGWADGDILPKTHRAWLKASDLPKFLLALDAYPGYLTTKAGALLLLLTFVRKRELIHAQWSEFDLDDAMWSVPPERMKMPTEEKGRRDKGHQVPLSTQVIKILKELKPICSGSIYLFPSNSSLDKPMSPSTLNVMFERMGYGGLLTPHGLRATASTILNEMGFRGDVIERQLAHSERNEVRRAYNHAEFMEERRVMMQEWANYIDGRREDATKTEDEK
nr:integrase arm-type DNA-binding domain-containing protein [uncultured Duganella sp.]